MQIDWKRKLTSRKLWVSIAGFASFVYTRPHVVSELVRDRAVITYDGDVVAAINVNDLILT